MQTTAYTTPAVRWPVPSATTPGVRYEVSADPTTGRLRCTCEASTYPKTRGRCWHIKAVAAGVIAPVPASAPAPAAPLTHDTRIVEGFDSFGRPHFTPLCHTCHRAGDATIDRDTAARLIVAHTTALAVRS